MARKKIRMLSAQEESRLLEAYLDNNDITARNRLIEAYMPLATRAAEAFAKQGTAQISDLVQEASLALSYAIDNFDRSKGARISTLAPYYIKSSLLRHVMDYYGVARIGTNFPDKKVFMNLRRMVGEIQARNGGAPITDDDRQEIADRLGVKLATVKRMEPRVFCTDVAVSGTDSVPEGDDQRHVVSNGIIAVPGEQADVETSLDQREVMARIHAIARESFEARDLEIVTARLSGEMTREKYDHLREKYRISVERIRQIQRAALASIGERLREQGITGLDSIAH